MFEDYSAGREQTSRISRHESSKEDDDYMSGILALCDAHVLHAMQYLAKLQVNPRL